MPKPNSWYEMFVNKDNGKNVGVIKIYDEIGGWGVTASMFSAELDYLGAVDEIKVYINSPGGSISEGLAIHNIIRRFEGKKTTIVDGIASSMASVIFMAGEDRIMASGTFLMIHNPLVAIVADSEGLRKYANVLDKMKQSIVGAYLRNVKKTKEDIEKMMDAETWIDQTQATLEGWATGMDGTFSNNMKFEPKNLLNIPENAKKFFINKLPDSVPVTINSNKKEVHMDLEQLKKEHPALYNQVFNLGRTDGVSAERARIQGIEALNSLGHDKIIAENKFKDDMTAEKMAMIINTAEGQARAAAAAAHQAAGNDLANKAGQIQVPGTTLDDQDAVAKERKELSDQIKAKMQAKK